CSPGSAGPASPWSPGWCAVWTTKTRPASRSCWRHRSSWLRACTSCPTSSDRSAMASAPKRWSAACSPASLPMCRFASWCGSSRRERSRRSPSTAWRSARSASSASPEDRPPRVIRDRQMLFTVAGHVAEPPSHPSDERPVWDTVARRSRMTTDSPAKDVAAASGSRKLSILLAMAMFVLVVDTSLMNVSISAVIKDLHTTASGVQSAIALEALVSAAFILINSKVGDLIGRKRAYIIGLLAYATGAAAMMLAQSLTAIIIFWAIIGGLGASLLLPAMQSLIHG